MDHLAAIGDMIIGLFVLFYARVEVVLLAGVVFLYSGPENTQT